MSASRSLPERFGRSLGSGWRVYRRVELGWVQRLSAKGISGACITAVLWVLKLAVLGLAVYLLAWLALPIFALLAVGVVQGEGQCGEVEESVFDEFLEQRKHEAKYKDGAEGFGLYRDGVRIDPYNPDDPSWFP